MRSLRSPPAHNITKDDPTYDFVFLGSEGQLVSVATAPEKFDARPEVAVGV